MQACWNESTPQAELLRRCGPQLDRNVCTRSGSQRDRWLCLSYWLFIAVFGFVVIGARVVLAVVVIYLLTPSQHSCIGCDGETLVLTAAPGFVRIGRLFAVERRWCVRCGRTTLIRSMPPPVEPPAARRGRPDHRDRPDRSGRRDRGSTRPHGNGGVTGPL
jgi:hypothetical protein